MQQRLIVEGKDAIVLTSIRMKKGSASPKGYSNSYKYRNEFIKVAEGDTNIKTALKEQLQSTDVEHIGIIMDADDKGAENRFKSLIDFIQKETGKDLTDCKLNSEGFCHKLNDNRTIGIWVMPDNKNEGYLENFVSSMIPNNDETWQFAQAKVKELSEQAFCKFNKTAKQKALVHTFLAWQKTPGLPMGTAIKAEFLRIETPLVENFIEWFQNTFELEDK